ncbi:cyclic-phosphate processing receiver domain-containing protein [Cohnella sp. AR92]|uniref:cyclic-phosphate processing receiver domain-containing protein n=1 Tax=Cohnella sp. AR92 TaxID=648716 RepID=UPI000F8DC352|nr:cyclic-phosphate processing receiver domain-containing protein [Cohnella sp. AR92]RUS46829.1 cell division protein FtsJ [Cohnella sp. AR92]
MINVFLDDMRRCPAGFVLARNAEECLLLMSTEDVNILSLDFELGIGEPNGLFVVHGIIAGAFYPREVFVHSSSMMGRAQMTKALREANPSGVLIHDGPMSIDRLNEVAAAAQAEGV